jgi:hypothetical protein
MCKTLPIVVLGVLGLVLAASACSGEADSTTHNPPRMETEATDPGQLACAVDGGQEGIRFGVNLDWERDSIDGYSERLGETPAVFVLFAAFPMDESVRHYVKDIASSLAQSRSSLMLTLEPTPGLSSVTTDSARALAAYLNELNALGTPVFLRFAHEMNGSWYAWSQNPAEYIAAFREIATAVHAAAPATATVWAPNYGGGYPFTGGRYAAATDSPAYALMDTNNDGRVSMEDDPYEPYYPGDDAVDWVGMSMYHWGSAYPWGENEVPEPDKFLRQLNGEYSGLGGDDSSLPNFYSSFGVEHRKPIAITETAAFYRSDMAGSPADEIKATWWGQVFTPSLASEYSQIKMINWFEWNKYETEVKATVDWTVTRNADILTKFRAAMPGYLRYAGQPC